MEIRPGTGGEEAALFAHNLFRMYKKYSERVGWQVTVLEEEQSNLGGLKSLAAAIKGSGTAALIHESGVHRVQRIPATERAGRIHTSTVSVAVLPAAEGEEFEIRPQDLRFDVFRASGPGGQYVNKRESAVRVVHVPTGMSVVSQTGRSQQQNRQYALALLRMRLSEAQRSTQKSKEGELRRSQIGHGERAEKIRTYNFPQDRLTDHRIKKAWHGLERILDGHLDPIMKAFEQVITDSEGKGR